MWNVFRSNGEYLLRIDEQYYIINEYAYDLLMSYKLEDYQELKRKYELNDEELENIYLNLSDKIENCDTTNSSYEKLLKIQWKLTNDCNLRCCHCYIGKTQENNLSNSQLMSIAAEIINVGVTEVVLSGGEPLILPVLSDIVNLFIRNNITVKICTNALLLTDFLKTIDLKFRNNLEFMISLDGLKENHEYIRGKGTFDKTIHSIKEAVNNGFNIVINSVVNGINYLDMDKLLLMTKELGVKRSQLSNIILMGNAKENESNLVLTDEKYKIFSKLIEDVAQRHNDLNISYAKYDNGKSFIYKSNGNEIENMGEDIWRCAAGQCKLTIDSMGNVYCCPFMEETYLGNILKSPLKDIWESPQRREKVRVIQKMNQGTRKCIIMRKNGL